MCRWKDNSSDEDLFELRVKAGPNGQFTPVNYFLSNAQFGTWYASNRFLTNIAAGTVFSFDVVACHATIVRDQATNQITDFTVTERSTPSNAMTLVYTITTSDAVLHAPTELTAAMVPRAGVPGGISDGNLNMTWKDGFVTGTGAAAVQTRSQVEDGFAFYVKEAGETAYPDKEAMVLPFDLEGFELPVYNFALSSGSYGLRPGVSYTMKMRSFKNDGTFSAFSNEVAFSVPPLYGPTNLVVTPINERSLLFTWDENSDNEHGYLIQIEIGEPFGDITWDSVGANQSSYIVNNLLPGTKAKWKITGAFNPGGTSGSYIFSQTPVVPPATLPSNVVEYEIVMPAPTNFQATVSYDDPSAETRVAMTWVDNAPFESGYGIYQRPHWNGSGTAPSYTLVAQFPANSTSGSIVNKFTAGTELDIVVRAISLNGSGEVGGQSAESNLVVITTKDDIVSASSAVAVLGQTFSHNVLTSVKFVRTDMTIANLPDGLSLNSASGAITGTPTETGVFVCPITASFADGWVAKHTLTLRIAGLAAVAPTTGPAMTRTIGHTTVPLPLSTIFADSDTERAVRIATTLGNIDMVLYPSLTPQTVANFLAYADNGDYANVAFHRVAPGFVLQGGAYKLKTAPDIFDEVPRRPSPPNEPGIKNLQWTVAMAKGSTPDSATHDFFINLVDNPTLDTQNEGFTVFGRLADRSDVRAVVDTIINKPGLKADSSNAFNVKLNTTTASGTSQQVFAPVSNSDFWPLDVAAAPNPIYQMTTALSEKIIKITSVSPLPLLSYAIFTQPDSAIATASLSNGVLSITGVADGSTSIVLRATDVDGRDRDFTLPIQVNALYDSPAITTQPVAVTAAVGGAASFSVVATGNALSYQWRKNGVPISGVGFGAQTATYNLPSLIASDTASYDVVVSNNAMSLASTAVALNVLVPISVTTPPASITRSYGGAATFTVVAAGSAPTYQWRKAGELIAGATSASYTKAGLAMTDAGDYDIIITNSLGSVTSVVATLTVAPIDTDGDGLYDHDEIARTLNPLVADSDGDGFSDGVEVKLGTDPKLASSKPDAFVTHRDAAAAIASIGIKRLIGGDLPDALNGGATVTVPNQWLGTHELTNEQFAALLHQAVRVMNIAEIVSQSGRRFVRYPKGTGEIVCYLSDATASPPSCDITADDLGSSFIVPKAKLKLPVRAVSWYGGYLASVALNGAQGYTTKAVPASWSWDAGAPGWSLPAFTAWQWAARGGAAALIYPTGNTISTAKAKLSDLSATAAPKTIGSYPASLLGYFDLAGNVAEWVAEGDASNSYTRGGSYGDTLESANNSTGYFVEPKDSISLNNGIRLALTEATDITVSAPPHRFVRTRDAISLSVTASGPPPLSYQWLRNGKPVAGATRNSLNIASAKLADGGAYTVKVTGTGTSRTSAAAQVAVVDVPVTARPAVFLAPNKPTAFKTTVAGAPGQQFKYIWSRNFQPLTNDYTVHGVDKPTLQIISAQQGMSDAYLCAIRPLDQPTVTPISLSFGLVVYELPQLRLPAQMPYGIVGVPYTYQVPYENANEPRSILTWKIVGLPPGLSFDPATGIISGTPTTFASRNIQVTATNPFGSVEASASLVIKPLPAYTVSTWQSIVPRHALNSQLGGRLDLSVTSTGSLSGKLQLGLETFPFKGNALATVNAETGAVGTGLASTITVERKDRPSLRLTLTLTPNINGFGASLAELPGLASPATFNGWRSICDLDVSATTANRKGLHTVALGPPATPTDATAAPQGVSLGSITIIDNGITTLALRLADGSVVTSTGLLGPEHILCYAPLYKDQGSVLGTLRVADSLTHTVRIAATESLTWLKKDLGSASTERSYRTGFGPLALVCIAGAQWNAPASPALLMNLTDTTSTSADNASLAFTSGGLAPNFPQAVRITPQHSAIITSANLNQVTLKPDAKTGQFTGKFTLSDGRVANYFGIMVPHPTDPNHGAGYGFFTLPQTSPTLSTSPILSGRVEFTVL